MPPNSKILLKKGKIYTKRVRLGQNPQRKKRTEECESKQQNTKGICN